MTGTVPRVPDTGTDTDTVAAFVRAHRDALCRGEIEAVAGCYSADATSFELRPPLAFQSTPAVRAAELTGWLAGFDGPVAMEIRDLRIVQDGDIAFCHSLNAMTATPMGSPAPFTLWFRSTLGLRRTGAGWRIEHEHRSTPFHMEMDENYSFRAATDLAP